MVVRTAATREAGLGLAITAVLISLGGLLLPVPSFIDLYQVPAGTALRPMGEVMMIFLAGIGSPLLAITFAILAFAKGGLVTRWLSAAGAILSLVPLPLYILLFEWIVSAHGLVLEP